MNFGFREVPPFELTAAINCEGYCMNPIYLNCNTFNIKTSRTYLINTDEVLV